MRSWLMIIAVIVFCSQINRLGDIGDIWDSHVYPHQGVEVRLGNRVIQGQLSRAWNGDFVITDQAGRQVEFKRGDIDAMRSTLPPGGADYSVLQHWRAFILLFAILGILVAWIGSGLGSHAGRMMERKNQ